VAPGHSKPDHSPISACLYSLVQQHTILTADIYTTSHQNRYVESLPELYSQALFRFDRLCPLQHFLSATPRESLARVRSLQFDWVTYTFIYGSEYVAAYVERVWEPMWARLGGALMAGPGPESHESSASMRELTVTVRPGWAGGWTVLGAARRERCEELLFGPIRRLEAAQGGGVVLIRCETC
jgi:hypothetical protein